jgi:hypothetical protein
LQLLELVDSGFWRWYALAPAGETAGADGARRISLAAPGYQGELGLDMTLDDRDGVCAVRVGFSEDWMHGDPAASALAVDFLSSLLRALEPDDAFVHALTAALKSWVGLAPAALDPAGDSRASVTAHMVDAVLGRAERASVRLACGGVLEVHRNQTAVVMEWLGAPEPSHRVSGES